MKYFFQPGRMSDLAWAELCSVVSNFAPGVVVKRLNGRIFFVDITSGTIDIIKIFQRLGGFIRVGEMIENLDLFLEYFNQKNITFGVSPDIYGQGNYIKVANEVKDFFKEKGVSSRYIITENTASVIHNNLIDDGFELLVLDLGKDMVLGRTLAVQDIEEYAVRDFDRPNIDKKMGMLPPKLARIMVNLLGMPDEGTVWDPFCGSGTILTEALTLGYSVLGSDIDKKAIRNSNANIEWTLERIKFNNQRYRTFIFDILDPDRAMIKTLSKTQIDGVAFEPFMGPPQRNIVKIGRAQELIMGVSDQLKAFVDLTRGINLRGKKVVFVNPSYKSESGWVSLRLNQIIPKSWYRSFSNEKLELYWERPHSIIRRNILIYTVK